MYPDALGLELARVYSDAIRARLLALDQSALNSDGLESPYVNEIAISSEWETVKAWHWRRPTHINLLDCQCLPPLQAPRLQVWPCALLLPLRLQRSSLRSLQGKIAFPRPHKRTQACSCPVSEFWTLPAAALLPNSVDASQPPYQGRAIPSARLFLCAFRSLSQSARSPACAPPCETLAGQLGQARLPPLACAARVWS